MANLPESAVPDADSVLLTVEGAKSKHPPLYSVQTIEILVGRKMITLVWVSTHIGIPRNELANHLANTGRYDTKIWETCMYSIRRRH